MRSLYELKEMLCDELDEIVGKGELSAGSLETVHKLTDTIKNIDKIEMFEEYDGEYSGDDDYSFARGRRRAKRDSMGRYSRDGYSRDGGYGREGNYRMNGYGGNMYSRDDGREHLMRDIREMMNDAKDEKQREAYRRAMKELENA